MSGAVHKTEFNPNPVQKNFIQSRAKADLFSSRMGEGKSTALCWSALYHTRHNPGAAWAIIRDTFENLQGTTMKTFFSWFPPGIYGTYNGSRKEWTWAEGVAKGTVNFLGIDDQQDASKLMSREFAGFAIDEPAPAVGSAGVDEMVFDMALSRLRQPGIQWYSAKLAENNPDEAHWTYRRFVRQPDENFRIWQPQMPENILHLPKSYYAELRKTFSHRPDLIRRFVDGEFGFQAVGKAVTPQWNDKLHLAIGLAPVPRIELILCWDFGLNPTCLITQMTPLGHWNVLEAYVGDGIGVEELISMMVLPALQTKYRGFPIRHIGDPAGAQREQSSSMRSAVRALKKAIPGPWRSGPVRPEERIEPLRSLLSRNISGRGVLQVDREFAEPVWFALRGGWHHHVARTGVVSGVPTKDIHSHPGDALSYGAAILFPMGRGTGKLPASSARQPGSYFPQSGLSRAQTGGLSFGPRPAGGNGMPKHGSKP